MKDTPRTDSIVEQISEFRISSIIYSLTKFSQKLERELNEARAEIERLDTAGIHSCHDNCQRPNCVLRRELKAVTEQRDGLRSGIDYASDQLHKVTEQRDRLADAITQYLPYVPDMQPIGAARHSDANVKAWALREAIQSLTTNKL